MKKIIQICFILSTILLLAGCSTKEDLRPVSIGNLAFNYDAKVWKHNQNKDQNAPLEFSDKHGNNISVNVSQESTYQHPLDMIAFFETMMSDKKDYEVFLEPTKIEVNGDNWYEFGFSYDDGSVVRKNYQRYHGKFYNAISISYNSTEENYDASYEEALKLLSDTKLTAVTNDENEAKAKKFLVGDWELEGSGLLVFKDDGTYEWYKDNTKDQNNMHYGTYGCDVENEKLGMKEGDGIYLCLFPEQLVVDGVAQDSFNYKSDYVISFENNESESYQMVNMTSYSLYTMKKQ